MTQSTGGIFPPQLLRIRDLTVSFPVRSGRRIHAVNGVDLDVAPGETVALVGESGSGKSTLARAVVRLLRPDSGQIGLSTQDGGEIELAGLGERELRPLRRRFQMVFQDPLSSLDPRRTAGESVAEPLECFGIEASPAHVRTRVAALFAQVGLDSDLIDRFPQELSGGQRQRVGLARALALEPDLLVLDEAVSALDVSLRAQVINLLLRLRTARRLSLLFITHDLAVVRALAHRVAVIYLGNLMEVSPATDFFARPLHPYSRLLLEAVPVPDPAIERRRTFSAPPGDPPSPEILPRGCFFAPRCPLAEPRCHSERPVLRPIRASRSVACHLV